MLNIKICLNENMSDPQYDYFKSVSNLEKAAGFIPESNLCHYLCLSI